MDYYEILGVRRNASGAEVRRAYQKLARQFHPDLNPGDPVATERFRAIYMAFEVLSDLQRRAAYDKGELQPPTAAPVPDVGFEGFDFSEARGRAGFQELFDGLLRRPKSDLAESAPVRGEDLEQTTRLSFEESLAGAKRRVHLVRKDLCPICRGSGDVAFGPVTCPRCKGRGQLRASRGHMIFSRACPDCGASGVLTRRACERCRGEGRVIQSEWLEVTIPPGASHGARVRVPGGGNAGLRGGPAGDFVLVVELETHPFYRREGDDLHSVVPVTIVEAALGGHIEVPTPDGRVSIQIPAGTQNGQRFRLRKRGAPRMGEGGRGDLYVEVRVWVPAITDDRSRRLLEEVRQLNPHDPRQDMDAASPQPPGRS